MTYDEIIGIVSKNINIDKDTVDKIYKAYWNYIRESIQKLPLKDDLTEDEFNKLSTNFNIPSIGKLCCTYDRYKGMKKRFEYIDIIKSRNNEKH